MGKPYFLPLLIFLVCGHASAQIAVGGTSENAGDVYWLQWDTAVEKYYDYPHSQKLTWGGKLEEATYIWYFSPEVRIIATINNLEEYRSGSWRSLQSIIEEYTPGTWRGDGLGEMYSSGGTKDHTYTEDNQEITVTSVLGVENSGLATEDGKTVRFDISLALEFKVEGTWNSVPYPGMVVADSEELNGTGEYISAYTNNTSTAWQLLDKRTGENPEDYRLTFDDNGTQFRIQAFNSSTGNQAVLFARGATGLNKVQMKGGGKTALALGFVLPFDVSEAERYCDARHYIDDFEDVETNFDSNTNLGEMEETPLNPIPSLYIGSSDNPLDHGSLDQEELEVNFKQDVITISMPVTNLKGDLATLYWWMDFNNDGIFAADEVKVFDNIGVGEKNKTVTLEFSKADFSDGYNHLGENLTVGPLHARFRITTTPLVDNPVTEHQDERSCGLAKDGEVEDYTFEVRGISISGTVFIDGNGMSNNKVDGVATGELPWSEGMAPLYAYLADPDGTIAGKTKVDAEGTYNITNMNHGDYLLFISQQNITSNAVNLDNLNSQLPSTWYAVGETFGDTNAFNSSLDDVIDLQVGIKTPAAGYDIKEVDFGVDQPPFLTNDEKSIAAYEYVEVAVQKNDTDLQTTLDGESTIMASSLKLVDAAGNLVEGNELVTAEGTFRITGTYGVSFKPFNNFHGETTSISYVLEDQAGLQSEPALLTIEVGSPRMIISNPMLPNRAKLTE